MAAEKCDGQTTYGVSKLDNLVDQIIHIQLQRIQKAPPQALIEKQRDREAEQVKAKAKLLREQYQQKQRDYQDLKEETLKVVRGTSRLNVDLLNNLIEETTVQMAELEGQIRTAEAELREVLSGAEQVRQEAKKMIAAQFVKAVRVKRGYEVDIEFNVSFEEFQTLYLEPESEEDRRSRSATYLSLVEKSGQAG